MADAFTFEQVAPEALRADSVRALRLAALAWSAQTEFYGLIPLSRDAILETVARQIAAPGFDMAEAFVLRDAADAGLVTCIDLASLGAAQMASLMAFMRLLPAGSVKELQEKMRAHSARIEPIDDTGCYVSRVSVAADRQGQGLGHKMMSELLSRGGWDRVHLHVHRDNARAIALYRSLGFVPRGGASYAFPAFTRAAG